MVEVFQDVSLTSLISWKSQMAHRGAQMVVTNSFFDMIEIRLKEQNTISSTAMAQLKVKQTNQPTNDAPRSDTHGRLRQED